jgi:hypothetical protein
MGHGGLDFDLTKGILSPPSGTERTRDTRRAVLSRFPRVPIIAPAQALVQHVLDREKWLICRQICTDDARRCRD